MTGPGHGLSRREAAVQALKDRPSGEVVTYEELQELIGVDSVQRVQSSVAAARFRLSIDHLKAVEAVRGVGYRIVPEQERIRLARADQARSHRSLKRGHRNAVYVDVRVLEDADVTALELAARSLAIQLEFNRRMDVRQTHIERALATVTTRTDRTENELSALKARLAALDGGDGEPLPPLTTDDDAPPPLTTGQKEVT